MMAKKISVVLVVALAAAAIFWFLGKKSAAPTIENFFLENNVPLEQAPAAEKSFKKTAASNVPLWNPQVRITKKPFGIRVDPKNSPLPQERFSGYHTGTDWEIFPEEADADVEVRAICEGEILQKKRVSGYGGVIIQECALNGETVRVLYGHLRLNGSSVEVGENFSLGDTLAILGADKSADTDGERKHLHLGIKKGSQTDLRGYVADENELTGWLDPEKIIFPRVL